MVLYTLADLTFVLTNLFFNSNFNREGEFDTLTYNFGEKYTCMAEEALLHGDKALPSYDERHGGWLRLHTEYNIVVEDACRLKHFHAVYKKLVDTIDAPLDMENEGTEGAEGDTTLIHLNKECVKILTKYWVKPCLKVKRHNLFSCVPNKRINVTEGEVSKMSSFLEKVCTPQYFKKVKWCLESGKHENSPNLHFHIFGLFNENGSKNFRKRCLVHRWNKLYPTNTLDWSRKGHVGIDNKACNTQQIINDSLAYLDNECKGSHENFIDLNVSGGFGF